VVAGETAVEPLRTIGPMPESITQVSALVEVQVKVLDPPGRMTSGTALILTVGAGWITVTVTFAVVVPSGPVAVIV